MSIQSKIDQLVNDKDKPIRRVVIADDSGDANVPVNVNVDFRNCTVGSLTCAGNNRINVEKGTLKSADLTDTAIIIRDATVSGDVKGSKGSKLEYHVCTLQGKTTLDASVLSSKRSTYSGSLAFDLSKASKVRSVKDTFSGTKIGTADGNLTGLDLIEPTITTTNLFDLTAAAAALIDGGTAKFTDGGNINKSAVEVRNCTSFEASSSWFKSNGGRVVLRKMTLIKSSDIGLDLSNASIAEVLDVKTVQAGTTIFKLEKSRLECTRFTDLKSSDKVVDIGTGSTVRIANGTNVKPTNKIGPIGSGSKIVFDKITTIQSQKLMEANLADMAFTDVTTLKATSSPAFTEGGSVLSLTNVETVDMQSELAEMSNKSSLSLKNCKTVKNQSGNLVLGNNQGTIHISGSDSIKLDGGIVTSGIFTVTIIECGELTSNGEFLFVASGSGGGSVVNLASIQSLKTTGQIAIHTLFSDLFMSAMPDVENDGFRGCVFMDSGGASGQSQARISRVVATAFSFLNISVEMFACTFKKFLFFTSDVILRRCSNTEAQSDPNDAAVSSSAVLDFFSGWQSFLYCEASTITHNRSVVIKGWKGKTSVIRTDSMDTQFGVPSYEGNGGLTAFYATGWTPAGCHVDAAGTDAIDLRCMDSTPDYTGHGSLFVMAGEACGEGLLDFIRIKKDDIYIFDYRNTYERFNSDIHRHSPNDIDDTADNDYNLQCSNAAENADNDFSITGKQSAELLSDSVVTIQAPSILEQS